MHKDARHGAIILPALRGRIGDWIYYAACVKMRDLAQRTDADTCASGAPSSPNGGSREVLDVGAAEIERYLLGNSERFLNALVIGVSGGDPDWFELSIGGNYEFPNGPGEELERVVGFLRLDGDEHLVPIDGRQRLVGIQRAIASSPELGDEEIIAILVSHRTTVDGNQRTSRLFNSLHQRPVRMSARERITLDERDTIGITARRLITGDGALSGRVAATNCKAVQVTDKTHITSSAALYDALDVYLRPCNLRGGRWDRFKRRRQDDIVLDEYYDRASAVWHELKSHVPELDVYLSRPADSTAFRYHGGGHLLFRPVGLGTIFHGIRHFIDGGMSVAAAVERVTSIPLRVEREPWLGVLWNPVGRMLTDAVNQRVARALMVDLAGGNLASLGMTRERLRREVAGLRGVASA